MFFPSLRKKTSSWSESFNEKRTEENTPTEPLPASFVIPGRILWLPAKKELFPDAILPIRGPSSIPDSIYARPVVVISRPARAPHRVHFQLITGFGGQSIEERFAAQPRKSRALRLTHIPIFPSWVEPKNNMGDVELPSAQLEGFDQMPMHSYVNACDVYSVEWDLLQPYPLSTPSTKIQHRLDYESINTLLSCTRRLSGYLPGPQLLVNELPPVKMPDPALATPFRPPPIPIKPYPKLSPPQPKFDRPVLSIVIPGKDMYGTISRHRRTRQLDAPREEQQSVEDCMSEYTSRVTSMLVWTGASVAQAWRNNTWRNI